VPGEAAPRTPEAFFAGHEDGLAVYRAVAEAVAALGECDVRVSRSQIAFRRRRGFAYVWRPGQYVASDVPAVLSVALDHPVESDRFKQVAHPAAAVWMHHLEVRRPAEVDAEVSGWLREAWGSAG
jgi:hypothetical protein